MQNHNLKNNLKNMHNSLREICAKFARIFHMRHRHMLTKNNKLRLRYMASIAVFTIVTMASLGVLVPHSQAFYNKKHNIIENKVIAQTGNNSTILSGSEFGSLASMTAKSVPTPSSRIVTIEPGDALSVVLEREGVGDETPKAIKALSAYFDPRDIKAGEKIYLNYAPDDKGQQKFEALKIKLDALRTVVVKNNGDGFTSEIDKKDVERVVHAKKAVIENSFYGSAEKAGIPQGIVAEAMKIYSWNVDFQRDIRKGDVLEVLYETFETEEGVIAKNGNILYANLSVRGQPIPLYRFEMADGRIDYFQPNGRSMKRTLMKTPVDGARISSGYGMRHHPVLGYSKMHKGIDFAAPTGTPIYAAGDGIAEKAGWFGSFGKYVRIRHNAELKTAYAHMSRIKVKQGARVKQGDVIGYIGTTGRSTGPHLHYEVLVNNKQTNPRSLKLPTGEKLAGSDLTKFKASLKETSRQFVSLLDDTKVAKLDKQKESHIN